MKKIDFALVITAEKCDPNSDPTNGIPRQDYDGYGEISDVCIKRKIRDRLYEAGENILILRDDQVTDGLYSVSERVRATPELQEFAKKKDVRGFLKAACEKWFDVRSFGQIFSVKGLIDTASLNTRGPVSIRIATSLEPVIVTPMDITKVTNLTDTKIPYAKDASTCGCRHIVDKGAYVAYGSIYPHLAKKTGFDDEDVERLKAAMIHLLDNDASCRRPSGSMTSTLFWMTHKSEAGVVSPAKAHRSLHITSIDTFPYFKAEPEKIPGIELEIYQDL